jgi:hypothetical protein
LLCFCRDDQSPGGFGFFVDSHVGGFASLLPKLSMRKQTLVYLMAGMAWSAGPLCWVARGVEWEPAPASLMTRWGADVNPTNVWPDYPRPQLVRPEWMNLNGLWDYTLTPSAATNPAAFAGKILVPFPLESALSGVGKPLNDHTALWYHRTFSIPSAWAKGRVRLHFGAVDWHCQVWVNGSYIGEHQGGYDAFTFDITQALHADGPDDILACVTDPTEGEQPRGKQSEKPEGVFYTSTSGIWQTVWLEPVPQVCIDTLKLVPDLEAQGLKWSAAVASLADDLQVEAIATVDGHQIARVTGSPNSPLFLSLPQPHVWSPEDPFLYALQVSLKRAGREVDRVDSYFGMRKVALKKDSQGRMAIALNDHLIFQVGVLDQGFWPDGIYTAPSDAALRFDLEFLKESGFNLVRKHVKVEPQRWYYWCDKLGLLVWQDMPSADNSSANARLNFEIELRRMIEGLYNHPAIVQWILFNEGWGQYDTERLVAEIKQWDPQRLVDDAAGWTDRQVGDIIDSHSYPEPPVGEPDTQRASVLGEFGGVGYRVEGHTWSSESWGYQAAGVPEGVTAWYLHLMRSVWRLKEKAGYCASVYTQISDVETECNGLLTYDRALAKIAAQDLKLANQETPVMTESNLILPNALHGKVEWQYTIAAPAEGWLRPQFDDVSWQKGYAGFGGTNFQYAKVATAWNSDDIWLRREFDLSSTNVSNMKLEMFHDDDVEVYLNGVLAGSHHGFLIDYACFDVLPAAASALRVGANLIAVHCHQKGGGQFIDVGIFQSNKSHK